MQRKSLQRSICQSINYDSSRGSVTWILRRSDRLVGYVMLVNLIFPFDDYYLLGYKRKSFSKEDRLSVIQISLVIIIIAIAFTIIGTSSRPLKLLLISPVIIQNISGLLLIAFGKSDKSFFTAILPIWFSISSFIMAITMHFYVADIGVLNTQYLFTLFIIVFLLFIPVGYRIHYRHLKKYGEVLGNKKLGKTHSAIAVVLALSVTKALSMHAVFYFLIFLWIIIHLLECAIVVFYRQFSRSMEIERK